MTTDKLDVSAFRFSNKRNDLLLLARTADAAERYEDMRAFMRALVTDVDKSSNLTEEERNLLTLAYKSVIHARLELWRILSADETSHNQLINTYKSITENQIEKICTELLDLLEKNLVPLTKGQANEPEVFYLKMIGDYCQYLAQIKSGSDYDRKASENYEAALQIAEEKFAPTHPLRLGLVLNYSVCCHEILGNHEKAIHLAKKAFDDAITKLDQLDESSYKDSTSIMQLLRDNLTLWTSDDEEDQ